MIPPPCIHLSTIKKNIVFEDMYFSSLLKLSISYMNKTFTLILGRSVLFVGSSTSKTDCQDITAILLKVAFNTITLTLQLYSKFIQSEQFWI
jgi:hypothetical protein